MTRLCLLLGVMLGCWAEGVARAEGIEDRLAGQLSIGVAKLSRVGDGGTTTQRGGNAVAPHLALDLGYLVTCRGFTGCFTPSASG